MSHKEDYPTLKGSPDGLRRLVHDYLEELEIAGRAGLTAKRYGAYLAMFIDWLAAATGKDAAALRLPDITTGRLRQFRLHLSRRRDTRTGKPIGTATRNLYQTALRNFLRYCRGSRELEAPDPDRTLLLAKERDLEIRHLERPDVERITGAVDLAAPNGVRDRAIIELLFGTGVRVSELAALTIRQVDLARREAEVIGKGGRSRLVLLTQDAADWVGRYLAERRDDSPFLFTSKRRGALGVRQVERVVDHAARRSGLPMRVSPHWFRHSRLTALARHAGVQAAQRIAGHASLQTTARYLHVTDPQLRSLYDKAEDADKRG